MYLLCHHLQTASQTYSIYIHLPFCKQRCPYCDFVSSQIDPIPFSLYRKAIQVEFNNRKSNINAKKLKTIYIGGGTPSLWPADEIAKLLKPFDFNETTEITVEVNPGDITENWYKKLLDIGVNRISVGVQAMDEERLIWLGRRHNVKDAQNAIELAKKTGFKSISVDLIYGTPGQTKNQLQTEIDLLCNLNPNHVSAYELTIANKSPISKIIKKSGLKMPTEKEMITLWHIVGNSLQSQGLARYEVSSYAQKNHKSIHNQQYWNGSTYLGLGAGAHGFIKTGNTYLRYANTGNIKNYLYKNSPDIVTYKVQKNDQLKMIPSKHNGFEEEITATDHARELIMLGFRTTDGVNLNQVKQLVSKDTMIKWNLVINSLIKGNLISQKSGWIISTQRGMLLADSLAEKFF